MNWLYTLWYGYFWPSLKGNGPEALIQTLVYGAIAYFLVPAVKSWVDNHMSELHKKVDHIIRHSPDIPEMDK